MRPPSLLGAVENYVEKKGESERPIFRHSLADLDGDGRADAIVLLEQTAPGQFERHSIATVDCDHVTCAVGDLYGDGKMHLVTGNFCMSKGFPIANAVTIWTPQPGP